MAKLSLYRGDSKRYLMTFTKNNEAIDISEWDIYFTIKKDQDDLDSEALIQKQADKLLTTGQCTVTLLAEDTDGLQGTYYYDFQAVKPDGSVLTLTKDTIIFKYDITRSIS